MIVAMAFSDREVLESLVLVRGRVANRDLIQELAE
jgi:hypothetical protein